MNNKSLSVCFITYNHEKYVAQALESILMQKTDFDWDLVVADDYSTDSTRAIIMEYKAKFSEKIHLIFQEKNVGPAQNFIDLITFPNSKYIAYLEGDDYWTDPYKLQKQYNILEQHPDCVLCFTDYSNLYAENKLVEVSKNKLAIKTQFSDLIQRNYIATLTVMYRNTKEVLPIWYKDMKIGDWPLYLWLMKDGHKAYYLKENTAVYRHGVGVSVNMVKRISVITLNLLQILNELQKDFSFKSHKNVISNSIFERKKELLKSYIRENQVGKVMSVYFEMIRFSTFISITKLLLFSMYKKIRS